jgi:hypothetical protein
VLAVELVGRRNRCAHEGGIADFNALQNAFDKRISADITYSSSKGSFFRGYSLRSPVELRRRQRLLETFLKAKGTDHERSSTAFDSDPASILSPACKWGWKAISCNSGWFDALFSRNCTFDQIGRPGLAQRKASMSKSGSNRKRALRTWVIQVALLCLIALHSVGLLHKHATAAEQDACPACQVADHQPLGVADAASGPPALLLALLCLVLLSHPGPARGFQLFYRPPARAPPPLFS